MLFTSALVVGHPQPRTEDQPEKIGEMERFVCLQAPSTRRPQNHETRRFAPWMYNRNTFVFHAEFVP